MGNNYCCKGEQKQLDLNLGPDDNIFQARYFYFYPDAKRTYDQLKFPNTYQKISKHLVTQFPQEGTFIGKQCKIRHGLGLYYIGNWINNNRQGLGYMLYKDGSYYQGQWYLNKPHGYGQYYNFDKKWFYKGKWKNAMKNGLGEQTFPDGTVFKGNFQNDLKEGQGMLIFNNQCLYNDRAAANTDQIKSTVGSKLKCSFKGIFVKDIATGFGIQKGEDYKYEGEWANNEMNGPGKTTYFEHGEASQFYIGQFKNGSKQGYGEYRWSDGRIYKGQWLNGEIISQGVFINNK